MSDYLKKFVRLLTENGVEGDALDEIVHHAKSQEASNINNGGLDEQVQFLISEGGCSYEEIWKEHVGGDQSLEEAMGGA